MLKQMVSIKKNYIKEKCLLKKIKKAMSQIFSLKDITKKWASDVEAHFFISICQVLPVLNDVSTSKVNLTLRYREVYIFGAN